jgi:hypothetical protein
MGRPRRENELVLVDRIKVQRYSSIDDLDVAITELLPHLAHGHRGRAPWAIPKGTVTQFMRRIILDISLYRYHYHDSFHLCQLTN